MTNTAQPDDVAVKLLKTTFGRLTITSATESTSWFAPVCRSCGVSGPSVRIERGTDQQKLRELMNKADELWNSRVVPNVQIHRPAALGGSGGMQS